MKAVDANILVYAHRKDSPWHEVADRKLAELIEGEAPWAIPWPCIHEFIGTATHPKIYKPPSTLQAAVEEVESWLESPSLVLIGEMPGYWAEIKTVATAAKITGPRIHDARIAAICIQHGVDILWSADRDLTRFTGLKVQNPLVN